ncbi:hypothetical protein B4N89_13530 [Embleya scabrispora]|uniref:Uncharacterized protein n=1 Tax=Embleya scabrispora TaxID=159449 RepID=A0A1T3NYS3_9ACTN|nr:hypothetical protein [Embleya scabrispora]OPC81821.1 hypothetical protein B4N89_13530 [Embleya scabrispora]
MPTHAVTLTGRGTRHALVVDGVDVSDAVAGVDLVVEVDRPARLVATLAVQEVTVDQDEVEVHLAPQVHAALVLLGWTPPAGGV